MGRIHFVLKFPYSNGYSRVDDKAFRLLPYVSYWHSIHMRILLKNYNLSIRKQRYSNSNMKMNPLQLNQAKSLKFPRSKENSATLLAITTCPYQPKCQSEGAKNQYSACTQNKPSEDETMN